MKISASLLLTIIMVCVLIAFIVAYRNSAVYVSTEFRPFRLIQSTSGNLLATIAVDGNRFSLNTNGKNCKVRGPVNRSWTGPVDVYRLSDGRLRGEVNIAALRRELCY